MDHVPPPPPPNQHPQPVRVFADIQNFALRAWHSLYHPYQIGVHNGKGRGEGAYFSGYWGPQSEKETSLCNPCSGVRKRADEAPLRKPRCPWVPKVGR